MFHLPSCLDHFTIVKQIILDKDFCSVVTRLFDQRQDQGVEHDDYEAQVLALTAAR